MNAQHNSGSLYVGDLHPDVTEQFLYEVFREVGNVVSIRVCRDAMTRKSLGYAYVNFQNPNDAERALDTLNYSIVKGMPIRIMWSQRDPSIRKSGVGNIFIKNLDKSIDNKALYDTFSTFGNILSCKVTHLPSKDGDENGGSGFGFVHFETQEAAEKAIAKMNNMILNGKQVYVGPFLKKNERLRVMSKSNQFTNVFIKNLDKSINEEQLRNMFSKFGEIQSCVVMRDENGNSKGFGFINFTDHDSAAASVEDMNGKEIEGKKIFVGRAQKKAERIAMLRDRFGALSIDRKRKYQGLNVYVKNLDDSIDDEQLKKEFSAFGEITSAVVMKDEKGNSRGFGFVCYTKPEEANRAVTEMHNKILGSKPLYVALAQIKEERRRQLEAQHQGRYPPMPMGVFPGPYFAPGPQGLPQGRGYPEAYPIPQPRWQRAGRGALNQPQAIPAPYGQTVAYPRGALAARGARGALARGGAPSRRGERGYKYTSNVRNRPTEQVPPGTVPQVPVQEPLPVQNGLTSTYLAQLSPEQQKQVLGEKLYPLVEKRNKEHAPKITGMLLDMEVGDILHLIEDPEALETKIDEAVNVLKESQEHLKEDQGNAHNE
jgi:polyadenylate-binding protein